MRSFTSSRPVWSASRTRAGVVDVEVVVGALAPRQLEHGVEPACGSSRAPCSARACARAGRSPARSPSTVASVERVLLDELGELRAVVVDEVLVVAVLAQLLADRAHLLAQQELALVLLHALGHVLADPLVDSSSSASASLAQSSTFSTRASTSMVSSSSTLRSKERSGHQPARSASAPGRRPREHLGEAAAAEAVEQRPNRGPQLGGELEGARRASPSSIGSACTHSAAVVPMTPAPTWARRVARTTSAGVPPGRVPRFSIVAMVPTGAYRPPSSGDEQELAAVRVDGVGRVRPRRSRGRGSPPSGAAPRRWSAAGRAG